MKWNCSLCYSYTFYATRTLRYYKMTAIFQEKTMVNFPLYCLPAYTRNFLKTVCAIIFIQNIHTPQFQFYHNVESNDILLLGYMIYGSKMKFYIGHKYIALLLHKHYFQKMMFYVGTACILSRVTIICVQIIQSFGKH